MSPEETTVSALPLDTETASAEKPKAVRRRRVAKTDDAEQTTLLADVLAPEKPKRAPRRTAVKKNDGEKGADTGADTNNAVAPQTDAVRPATDATSSDGAPPQAAPTEAERANFTPQSSAESAAPIAPAPQNSDSAPENAPDTRTSSSQYTPRDQLAREQTPRQYRPRNYDERDQSAPTDAQDEARGETRNEPESRGHFEHQNTSTAENDGQNPVRENSAREANSDDEAPRFAPRNERGGRSNFGRETTPNADDSSNGASNADAASENRFSGGQNSGENGGDSDRNAENRLRFRGDRPRNQLRRDRNDRNNSERNASDRNNSERNGNERNGNERNNRNGRFDRNGGDGGFSPQQPRRREVEIAGLQAMEQPELIATAAEFGLETLPEDKDALIYAILEAQAHSQNAILKRGTLEILHDGKGFLRCDGYLPADGDVYVSQSQIKRFNLKTGDLVLGTVRTPKEMERFHGLLRVESINGLSTEAMKTRKDFEKLTPIFPTEKFVLETEATNITARIIDLVSPIGKGSRGLIVAPPKAGKTTLIKNIANSIAKNHPEIVLIVLLIDERPEEVTDISRSTSAEVVASTFDEMPDNHMRVADIVLEKAKRLVEMKRDVVILMDSITRLSRASNLVVAPSGRTLSGGLDPAAMYRPKRMFGAARNIEEGGSLTILATALVDTGSRMDEMIFEEFKGTGNLDLVLDRNLFDQRIFPAIDINRSGTRRDDLLLGKEDLATIYHLRRTLAQLDNDKAVTLLIDRLKNTRSNLDFMGVVAKSARNTGQGAG